MEAGEIVSVRQMPSLFKRVYERNPFYSLGILVFVFVVRPVFVASPGGGL